MQTSKMRDAATCVVLLMALPCLSANSQTPPYSTTRLVARTERSFGPDWRVLDAELQESFTGTMGTLKLLNASTQPLGMAPIYAEYLDSSGRYCFSLVFTQDDNLEKRTASFAPGEVRTLEAGAYYLGPSVKPAAVNLYQVRQSGGLEAQQARGGRGGVYSPVMLEEDPTAEKLWLAAEPEPARGPFLDLALARVAVGDQGAIGEVEVVDTLNDSVREWFGDFLRKQRFRPAELGRVPVHRTILVLLRARVSLACLLDRPYPARASALIEHFAETLSGVEIPPTISLILVPEPSGRWWEPRPARYFELTSIGAGWWSRDTAATEGISEPQPSAQGPPLRRVIAPPESYACP